MTTLVLILVVIVAAKLWDMAKIGKPDT